MDLGEDSEYTGNLLPMPDTEAPGAEEIEKHNTLSQVDQEDDGINEAFRNDTVFDSELLMANIKDEGRRLSEEEFKSAAIDMFGDDAVHNLMPKEFHTQEQQAMPTLPVNVEHRKPGTIYTRCSRGDNAETYVSLDRKKRLKFICQKCALNGLETVASYKDKAGRPRTLCSEHVYK